MAYYGPKRGRPQKYLEPMRSHTFQFTPRHIALIEHIAAQRGCSKSEALRLIIDLNAPPSLFPKNRRRD